MMAVYATTIVGFSSGQFIVLYLVSTVSTILGSLAFGYITKSIGAKRAISIVALIMIVALVFAVLPQHNGCSGLLVVFLVSHLAQCG